MNPDSLTLSSGSLPKLTYPVLIKAETAGEYEAKVLGWPNCKAQGITRQEALLNLRQLLVKYLSQADIVSLEIELPTEHPWLRFAGRYKDDSQFDEVLEHIEAYRRELDAELEVDNHNLSTQDEVV